MGRETRHCLGLRVIGKCPPNICQYIYCRGAAFLVAEDFTNEWVSLSLNSQILARNSLSVLDTLQMPSTLTTVSEISALMWQSSGRSLAVASFLFLKSEVGLNAAVCTGRAEGTAWRFREPLVPIHAWHIHASRSRERDKVESQECTGVGSKTLAATARNTLAPTAFQQTHCLYWDPFSKSDSSV